MLAGMGMIISSHLPLRPNYHRPYSSVSFAWPDTESDKRCLETVHIEKQHTTLETASQHNMHDTALSYSSS